MGQRNRFWLRDSDAFEGVSYYGRPLEDWPQAVWYDLYQLTAGDRGEMQAHMRYEKGLLSIVAMDESMEILGWALVVPPGVWASWKHEVNFYVQKGVRGAGIGTELNNLAAEYFPNSKVFWAPGAEPVFLVDPLGLEEPNWSAASQGKLKRGRRYEGKVRRVREEIMFRDLVNQVLEAKFPTVRRASTITRGVVTYLSGTTTTPRIQYYYCLINGVIDAFYSSTSNYGEVWRRFEEDPSGAVRDSRLKGMTFAEAKAYLKHMPDLDYIDETGLPNGLR